MEPILAFGGNDRASRSARAKLQWRDRYGRFIEMGRGVKFKIRVPRMSAPVSVIGKFVGSTDNPDYGQVYVSGNAAGIPDGFYTVKSSNAAEVIAHLTPQDLSKRGITPGQDMNGNLISSRTNKDVQDFADLHYSKSPLGWSQAKDGTFATPDGSFKVKDSGNSNGYALYHNNNFVGYYPRDGWDQILTKADALDNQEEQSDANKNAPVPQIDHTAEAKDALAPVDKDGTAAKMLDAGKKPEEILAHLRDNSPEYQALKQKTLNQGASHYRGPAQKAAQAQINEITRKIHAAHRNPTTGGERLSDPQVVARMGLSRGKSADGIEIPTAPNRTNDTTRYAVEGEGGQIGRPATSHQLNRTEWDIYHARKEVARQEKLLNTAEAGVNGPGRIDGAPAAVQQRRQAAAQRGLEQRRAALAEAQANLDKLEKAAGLKPKDEPQTNNDANPNVVDAQAPTAPAATPHVPAGDETPLVLNDNTDHANVSTPSRLDPAPYQPKGNMPDGTSDDPKVIAQEFNKVDLQNAFTEAVASGDSDVRLQFPNGTAATIPSEAIRDAIQHQGHDTNTDTNPDPQITTQDALDALPTGSKVQRGTITLTKDDKGNWVSPKGAIYQNLMQTSADNNIRLSLLDNAGDKNAPSKATPINTTDAAPSPAPTPDKPTTSNFKSTKDLQRGDEIANGTILNVFKQTFTPKGKSEVRYLDNKGNIRKGQWWDSTQIGLVKRPARPLPGDSATPAPTPNAPQTPAAPARDTNVHPPQTMKRAGHDVHTPLKEFQVKGLKDGDSVYFFDKAPGLRSKVEGVLLTKKGDKFLSSNPRVGDMSVDEVAGMAKMYSPGADNLQQKYGIRYAGHNVNSIPDGAVNPEAINNAPHALKPGDPISEQDFRKLVPGDRIRLSNPGAMADRGVVRVEPNGKKIFEDTGADASHVETNKFVYYIGNANDPNSPKDGRQDELQKGNATPAPSAATDTSTPAAPDAQTPPPNTSTDANGNAVPVPDAPTPTPTPAAANDTPPTDKELAKHLAKTRVNPGGDKFLDMALDDVINNADPSPLAIAYVLDKMKNADKIQRPKKQDNTPTPAPNAPSAPQPPVQNTPNVPANPTPDGGTQAPAAPQTPNAPTPNPTNTLTPNGQDINDPDLVLKAVRAAYPNHKELKNGDLVLGSREVTGPGGARRRYDMIVTRTGHEYFYTYIRETNLTDGTAKSQRFGPMVHSAKALDTRIQVGLNQINDRRVATWFNSRARRPFVKDDALNPATGEREHLKEQPVPSTTIDSIRTAINDNQVTDDLIRNIYDTIVQLGTSKRTLGLIATQHNLSNDKINTIVDAINQNINSKNAKQVYQTWVSSDGVTPLFEGDIVQHVDGRIGRVNTRIVDHATKGYGYPDYIFFQELDANGNKIGNQRNMTTRKFTIVRTAQGTDGSERIGPNAVNLPAPTLSTRAQNRVNKQNAMRAARQAAAQPTPPQPVTIDRTNPAAPTVNVNGTDHPANLTRTHTTQNDTPTNVPASQVQPGDIVQTYDPTTDKNRLGQVVTVQPTQDGTGTTITSVVPNDGNSDGATAVTTTVPGTGNDSQGVAVLRPQDGSNGTPTQADIDRLREAFNKADTEPNKAGPHVLETLRVLLNNGDGSTKADIDRLVDALAKGPQRQDKSINTNDSLKDSVKVAQAVAADNPQATDLKAATDQAVLTADAVSTPSGRVQAIIAENAQVTNLASFVQTSGAKGSNPGGFFKDPNTGEQIYVKFQPSADRAANEVLASALYRAVGLDAATILRGKRPRDRRPATYSPLVALDRSKSMRTEMRRPDFAAKIHDGFAIDAWLANWDGTVNDNIGVDTNGNPVHMDLGGAIRYRARGQLRTDRDFGQTVPELQTLVNGRNSAQWAAYGRMSEADKKRSAGHLLNISDTDIDTLVKEITADAMQPQESQKLADTLKARRKFILDTYGIQDTSTPAPTAQQATPNAPAAANDPYDAATIAAANPGSDPNVKWGNPKAKAKGIPLLSGYAVKVDADGTHYVDGWKGSDAEKIRKGQLAVPALPFKMKANVEGDTHFYDMSGTRRWGALGAAGAMIRRKNADGTYSFLMAQRGSKLSTDPNTWSIITGANSNHQDAADPQRTARKELGEEVKVDEKDIKHTHNYDVAVDPAWKFTYSFFDLDPAAADKYANVQVKQTREIQKIGWVSEADLLSMSANGKLHSAMSQKVVDDIKRMSDQNPFSYGSAASPAALPDSSVKPVDPATPNAPAAPDAPQAPDAPPASQVPDAGMIPQDTILSENDILNAPVGQIVRMDAGSGPRGTMEFIRTNDGWRYNMVGGNKVDLNDNRNALLAKDQTDFLNKLIPETQKPGSAIKLLAGPTPTPNHVPVADGQHVDENWEVSAPAGTIAHAINTSQNKRYEFEKQADNTWKRTANSDEPAPGDVFGDPARIGESARQGELVAGALPARDEGPLGQEVDEKWVNTVKSGAKVTFRSRITGSFQSLSKINANEWTDGQNIFSNDSVNRLRNNGRNKLYSGPVPDTSNLPAGQGAVIRDSSAMDAMATGDTVNFLYRGNTYNAVKKSNGMWVPTPADPNTPVVSYDNFTNKEISARYLQYYADRGIYQGSAVTPLEDAVRQQTTPTQARTALGESLAKVDPNHHIAAVAPLGFMSDEQINALNADIGTLTGNYTREMAEDEAHRLIEKYRPAVPTDMQGWLALADGLANEVDQLRALAGERDAAGGADNLEFAHANYVLAAISTLRGFDQKPTFIDKSDRSSFGKDVLKVHRGVKGYRNRTPKQMLDQFRNGDMLFAGSGVYGNGTYTSTWRQRINEYTNRHEADNKIVIGLPLKDMKILDYEDPATGHSNHSKYSREFTSELEKFLAARGLQPGTADYEKAYNKIYNLFTEQTKSGNRRTRGHRIDVGVYAALMGYDAIRKRQGSRTRHDPNAIGGNNVHEEIYYILLNRGKVIVGNGK